MLNAVHIFSAGLGFIPHGHCYLWQPALVSLHLASDLFTAIAYYSIPLSLFQIIRKRQDLPFNWIFLLFSAFIVACGTTHLLQIWTLWHPVYWLSGSVKAITAIVSLYTAVALTTILPKALVLPSSAQLEAANRRLESEIAERKQIEETLRQSEAHYRAVVEDQTELICRFWADGTFSFVNQAYCRYFDKTPEELIGHNFEPIVLEEDRPFVEEQIRSLSPENPVVTITNRVVLPNQQIRTHQWINRAIFDASGQLAELQAVGRDVTEVKQVEAALQESQRFIQKIADTAPVGLYVHDFLERRNVYSNHGIAKLLGYEEGTTSGEEAEALRQLLHPEDVALAAAQPQRWQAVQEGEVLQAEYRMRHANGEWHYLQIQETLFSRTVEGLPKQVLGAAMDITDRKQAEHLQAMLTEKEVLLKEIHHRVKNNLQIVYSLLRLQSRRISDPQIVGLLLDSQNRVKSIALIHEKLYQSKDLAKINLKEYIPNLVTSIFSSYKLGSNSIDLNVQVDNLSLDIDTAIPCGLIINELVSNALKYAFPDQQDGVITVDLSGQTSHQVTLSIGDNGIGLPDNFSFSQAPSLGLRLVKDLTSQLNGELKIDRNQGTQFTITFPKRDES